MREWALIRSAASLKVRSWLVINVSDGVITSLGVKNLQLFDRNFSEISQGVMRRFEKIASKDFLRNLFGCGIM